MGAAPAVDTAQEILTPPTDAETMHLYNPAPSTQAALVNEIVLSHPIAVALRKDNKDWVESRPHMKIPPAMRPHNLTGGTLLGEDKIVVPPLTFQTKGAALPEMVSLQYLGKDLCGHPGIIHGGLSATLLDEGLARCCFPALPNKVGVTASLKIDYKAPIMAEQIVILRAQTTKAEGRKVWVKGQLETTEGVVLVQAEALFIEPRQAAVSVIGYICAYYANILTVNG